MRRPVLLLPAPLLTVAMSLSACESDPVRPNADVSTSDVSDENADGGNDGPDATTNDTSEPADTTPPPEPWQHIGPVTTADRPEVKRPLFIERSPDAIAPTTGLPEGRAMVVDFDGDGRDDVVALGTTNGMNPKLLRNATPRGSSEWAFEDVTADAGFDAPMTLLVFGDIDNDGDQDAFSGTSFRAGANGKYGIWKNDGAGHFTYAGRDGLMPNILQGSLYKEMAAATLADLDKDGILDLYVAMWNLGDLSGNLYVPTDDELYKGDGTGAFATFILPDQHNPLTSQVAPDYDGVPRRAYGLCPADYDDDGDLDLFVNNYGAGRPAAGSIPLYWDWNLLWRNDGGLKFTDVGVASKVHATMRGIGGVEEEAPLVIDGKAYPSPIGGNGFGCSWGDFDNDGDLDLAVGQIAHPDYSQTDRLMLHTNPGGEAGSERVFGEESAARGLEYYEDELHPVFVDIDLDGRLDLAVSRLRGGSKWEVYLQTPEQHFVREKQADSGVDITTPGPTVWLDVEGDGDLDFFMPKNASAEVTSGRLFENVAGRDAEAGGNFLVLKLKARAPRDATGARITLKTKVGSQMRELVGGTGHYNSQQTRGLYFGLGGDSGASDVRIRWPDGTEQALGDVKSNLTLEVEQGGEIRILE